MVPQSGISVQRLTKWVDDRYQSLLAYFKDSWFSLKDAVSLLRERHKDSEENVVSVLSELKSVGLVEVEKGRKDPRKKLYKLSGIIDKELEAVARSRLTKSDLESLLKKAADLIRTRVDYKFILILLFLKRLSDKWQQEYEKAYNEAIRDGLSEADAQKEAENSAYHDFDIPKKYLWDNIRKNVTELSSRFSEALREIAKRNQELKDVVDNADFITFARSRENEEILRQLVELFSAKKLYDVSSDILGDAYEWILRYFAPQKAKEGEIYTPREVISLLINILDPKPGESVYDPACGSGGMLISAYEFVRDNYSKKDADKLFLFGQEASHQTLALGRMNLYIHDIRDARLSYGDTLRYPSFKENGFIRQFNVVIANPPWNQDGYDEKNLKNAEFLDKRFQYGMVPKQSADWLWIQHMLASSDSNSGRVGVVIDNGALFRGGKEKSIRTQFIDTDYIESVILLPEKLFYNTGAPGAILILRKNKPKKRKGKILFINASELYEKHPDVRKLNCLSETNIKEITEVYSKFIERKNVSSIVSLQQIKGNDYNLNVSLYIYPEEEEEEIDIKSEYRQLQKIESELKQKEKKIEGYLKELDIL